MPIGHHFGFPQERDLVFEVRQALEDAYPDRDRGQDRHDRHCQGKKIDSTWVHGGLEPLQL